MPVFTVYFHETRRLRTWVEAKSSSDAIVEALDRAHGARLVALGGEVEEQRLERIDEYAEDEQAETRTVYGVLNRPDYHGLKED